MVIHPSYQRPHLYLVAFIIIVVLTAVYVIGLTNIFNNNSDHNTSNSSSTPVTKIFGTPAIGDIGAGTSTATAFISQDLGGSGIFFYAVAFVRNGEVYDSTNSVFLGDRIAPQNVSIENGVASFNYCERNEREPMTAQPSICITQRFQIKNGVLVTVTK